MAGASAHGLPEDPEVASVRAGERFDEPGVDRYLRARLPELADAPPLEVLQFPGGHANLTYLLRFGERELVLRRPPLGPVAPRSHDMTREYKVLSGLEGHFDRKPRAWLLCEDPTLIGAVFLTMERMHGIVVRSQVPAELDRHADAKALEALIPLLRDPKSQVRLWAVHSISCDTCKLGGNPIDTVPLLIERVDLDESIKVRRMATAMLATQTLDARVVPVFERILDEEHDRKLKLQARNGLTRYRELGLGV